MKKVNNLLLKAFAVFAVFTMVSCSNDDDNTNTANPDQTVTDPFIGSWKAIGFYEDGEYVDMQNDDCEQATLTINANNTGSIFYHDCDFGDETIPITWEKLNNNKYKVVEEDGTSILNTVFDGDKMTITAEGDEGYSNVFQRQ